jgi:hypothetical protein
MTILIYFYGAKKPDEYYSFITQDQIVPMTAPLSETEKGWRIDESVRKFDGFKATHVKMKKEFAKYLGKLAKATSTKSAPEKEKAIYEEVWEDLTKDPAERLRGSEFEEDWEYEDELDDDGTSQGAEEPERVEILSNTPKHIHDVFGHLALAGRQGKADPALVLSPFSIPPGSVRDRWMKMFQQVRAPPLGACIAIAVSADR